MIVSLRELGHGRQLQNLQFRAEGYGDYANDVCWVTSDACRTGAAVWGIGSLEMPNRPNGRYHSAGCALSVPLGEFAVSGVAFTSPLPNAQ